MEIGFSSLNIQPNLSRSTSVGGHFANNKKYNENRKIEEGVALHVRREKDCKKIIKCWTCNEFGHYVSKCPKIEKVITESLNLEEIEIFFMPMKKIILMNKK